MKLKESFEAQPTSANSPPVSLASRQQDGGAPVVITPHSPHFSCTSAAHHGRTSGYNVGGEIHVPVSHLHG